MDYDEYIIDFVKDAAWGIEPENFIRGEDISEAPGVKIIFESYGDLEQTDQNGDYLDTIEGGNQNQCCFVVFVHCDSLSGEFPQHDTAWNLICHRPSEEVCIYVWHDVEADTWDIEPFENNNDQIDPDVIYPIIEQIWTQYYGPEYRDPA